MKAWGALTVILWGLAFPAFGDDAPDHGGWSKTGVGQAVDFGRLVDLDGKGVDVSTLPPVVVLHFWATWCEPCMEEFPRLVQFAKGLDARKVAVIAVSEDKGGASEVKAHLEAHPAMAGLKILIDPGRKSARALGVGVLPTTLVVKAGGVVSRAVGSLSWNDDDLKTLSDNIGN